MSIQRRRFSSDTMFDCFNTVFMTIVLLAVLYPLYFIVIASISDPNAIYSGQVVLLPKALTLEGYKLLIEEKALWIGYKNTIIYTIVGTIINVALTVSAAFAFSKDDLPGKNFFMYAIVFTMYFGGGLIPTYILIKNLGMSNTMWALILPGAVSAYNLIIARSFMKNNIEQEIVDAAFIDGCSYIKIFFMIILPLSKALIAVMVLFYGVGHWNSYFSALIYLRDENKYPLQLVLRKILIVNEALSNSAVYDSTADEKQRIAELVKYGAIIVSSIPVLAVYPFVQKYFVQGVMIGSIKG